MLSFQARRMWMQGTPLALVDSSLEDTHDLMFEISRCIHVSLLCVQQIPEDRPNMSVVVLMLNGESILPQPRQPGFLKLLLSGLILTLALQMKSHCPRSGLVGERLTLLKLVFSPSLLLYLITMMTWVELKWSSKDSDSRS